MSGESIKESDASDNSFVIIGPGSFNCTPSFVNEIEQESIKVSAESDSVTETQNATQDNLAISTSSTGSNIFDCDLQEKLNQQLLKENYQLKETLSQNNLAIKTQLNTFFMWQQEVLKTQESHKQKFLETKDLIWKLREENAQLKSQLEDIGHESLSLDSTDKIEDSEILIVGKPKPNDKSLKQLKQDLINFEVENQNLLKRNDYLVEQCNELQIKLRDSRKEIFELNKQLEDSERENTSLKQKITNVKSSNESAPSLTLSNHEARSQIRNLFKQLEDERAKVLILKQELKKVQSNGKDNEVNKNPTEELTEYLDQLSDINTSFKNQNQRFSGLNSWINLAEENLDCGAQTLQSFDGAIMSELTQLKDYLKVEENAFKRKEEYIQEIRNQFTRLLNDYKDLQQKLNYLEANNASVENFKKDVESLTSQLKAHEEKIKLKNDELMKLREEIKKLNLECEGVAIFKIQAELYRSDFNEERAAREKMVSEKEEMAEQIRILQSKIQTLEQKSATSSEPASISPLQNKKSHFVCPKCMFSFKDLKQCEEHVDDCLNVHFYP